MQNGTHLGPPASRKFNTECVGASFNTAHIGEFIRLDPPRVGLAACCAESRSAGNVGLEVPLARGHGTKAGGPGTKPMALRCRAMFLFFSNGLGIAGSIALSIALTLVLLYACSGP
jgi:hypothetical protein